MLISLKTKGEESASSDSPQSPLPGRDAFEAASGRVVADDSALHASDERLAHLLDVHDNEHVYIRSVIYQGGSAPGGNACPPPPPEAAGGDGLLGRSDLYVKRLLLRLLEVEEAGERIMTEKVQWYAVYKVLTEKLGYPCVMAEFVRAMQLLGMDRVSPPVCLQSLKKAPKSTDPLLWSVDRWPEYLGRASEPVRRQIRVAMKLLALMERGS